MIDVTSIINDPDFNQPFSLIRDNGAFDENNNWVESWADALPLTGIVLPAKLVEKETLPEGERQQETIAIYSLTELRLGDNESSTSDIILYDGFQLGARYRLQRLRYYAQCLLWYGLATRFKYVA